MGGFPSLAPALAAKVLGIPLVIHEQNANMGLANRLLSPIADRVLLSFSETRGSERFTQFLGKRRKNFIVTGNPVRREIIEKSKGKLGQELLVMGGSGGSRRIIEAIVQAAPSLAQVQGLRLRLATGRAATAQEVTEKLRRVGLAAEVVDYIDDMAEVLSRAKLVLARAGATTVAEIAASGRPAILIPWDGAAADHQRLNAEAQARSGGFIVISQGELGQVDLGKFIESLWQDEERLSQLSASSRAESRPDAARRVALVLIEVARERK
jgi:UDP-N-acetylglucosamine--N-acetylmuramyl-(pentapeptide) pyrophosphoryl-undecaprenol N-acetylglucosamine transferase